MKSCACCGRCATENLFLQNQREISVHLVEKHLKLERPGVERFYALYREQFNPDLTLTESVVENGLLWERLEQRKNHRQAAIVVEWTFAERPRR